MEIITVTVRFGYPTLISKAFTILFSVYSLVLVLIEKIYLTLETVSFYISKHLLVRLFTKRHILTTPSPSEHMKLITTVFDSSVAISSENKESTKNRNQQRFITNDRYKQYL